MMCIFQFLNGGATPYGPRESLDFPQQKHLYFTQTCDKAMTFVIAMLLSRDV